MGDFLRRALLIFVFAAAVGAVSTGRAAAGVEYCGATVAAVPVGMDDGVASTVYAMMFSADNPRTVTGTAVFHTNAGYFSVDFKDVAIVAHTEHYRAPWITFTRENDYSDYVFVKFPQPVTKIASWIASSAVTNDPASGWDGAQHPCPSYDSAAATSLKRDGAPLAKRTDPTPAPPIVTSQTAFVAAQPMVAPPAATCATPFAPATVTKAVAPHWPSIYSIRAPMTTLVRVRVSPEGTIDDAAVYLPTGVSVFDEAAVKAARASTYTARRASCKNVPGDYLFRVEWRP